MLSGDLGDLDLEAEQELSISRGHEDEVRDCAITPDGRLLLFVSDDETLKIWSLDSEQVITTLRGHTSMVWRCAVTPDGRRAVSAARDCTLKVWDLASGVCLLTHHGDAGYAPVAATSTTLVAGADAGAVWSSTGRRRGADHARPRPPAPARLLVTRAWLRPHRPRPTAPLDVRRLLGHGHCHGPGCTHRAHGPQTSADTAPNQ